MIRSSIGIVCVLVFLTTCAQSTAAQAYGEHSLCALRGRALQSHLSHWIELADQGISDRILSSDAFHDKFRFRASPVKQSRNWQMPVVDVRPAKDISIAFDQPQPAQQRESMTQISQGTRNAPVVNWVWESPSSLAVRYSELDDPVDQGAFEFIPRPLPQPIKSAQAKRGQTQLLKLKLVKVTPAKAEPTEQPRAMTSGRRDYWDYYGDCDRWDVVFAIPATPAAAKRADSQKIADASASQMQIVKTPVADRKKSEITVALQDLAAVIADRWENAIAFYRTISKQFLASRS